jgi:hypothetical protein
MTMRCTKHEDFIMLWKMRMNGAGRTDFSGRLETRRNGFSEKRVYSQTYILNLLKRQEYRKYLLIY